MNPFHSLARPIQREEEMDAAGLDPAAYARVLNDLARVNTMTLARRPTLAFLDRLRQRGARRLRILDVGYGDGDMLRAIHRWGVARGVETDLAGIDLNPNSQRIAAAASPHLAIDWRTGDYRDSAGQGWDVVISSLVAHHMSHAERIAFLTFMEREATAGWFINDLHRHRFPFMGFPLLALLMGTDPIVRRDGQLSVGRSFRRAEWTALLDEAGVEGAQVRRWFPWRLCVERLRPAAP